MTKNRMLCLDVGTKRIGLALSDELLITAQGLDSLERKALKDDLEEIRKIAQLNGVSLVVVGLPLNMDGSHSAKTKEVIEFADQLSRSTTIPIKLWDERLTSVQAERILLEADMSRSKRRRLSDKLAAQIILQSFMDAQKRTDNV